MIASLAPSSQTRVGARESKRLGARSASRLALRLNTTLCLGVLFAILSYCAAEDGTLVLAAISSIGCFVGWSVGRGTKDASGRPSGRPRALPRLLVNFLVLAALLDAGYKVLGGGRTFVPTGTPIVSVLAEFLVYIQLIKLFDRRAPRDDAHAIGLSIFIVIGAILTSNQLLVGALLVIYTPVAIASAMMLQVMGGWRGAEAARAEAGLVAGVLSAQSRPPNTDLVSSRSHRRDFRITASIAILVTVALAGVVFVLMPRGLGENVLGAFGRVGEGTRIGFTDQIQLGRTGKLQSDDTPVMDVRVRDSRDTDISEQLGTVYLRGTVRNKYNPQLRTWETDLPRLAPRASDQGANWEAGPGRPVTLSERSSTLGLIRVDISYRRGLPANGYIFSVWRPLRIIDMSMNTVIQARRNDVVINGRVTDGQSGVFRYSIESAPEHVDRSEEDRERVSFPNPRVRELAEGLLSAKGISIDTSGRTPDVTRRAVSAFMDHLRGTCEYSTDMIGTDEGEDPIDMFLFRTQQGHCEYFASSLVALCQSVGIDARLVAGYLAAEYSGLSSGFVVRQSNAHAWAEVRIDKGRWQRFDPSPPDAVSAEHRPPAGLFSRLRQFYEALNFTWTNSVITFDRSKQTGLVGSQSQDYFYRFADAIRAFNLVRLFERFRHPDARQIGMWILIAVGLITALYFARRTLRSHRSQRGSRRASATAHDAELRSLLERAKFYERLLDVLKRAGLAKPLHAPPLAHAGTIAMSSAVAGADAAALSKLYYQVRFGRRALDGEQTQHAELLLERLERTLTQPAAGGSGLAGG